MSKLMEELMAEAERVSKLETEVKTAETNLKNEIGLARQEKYTEIRQFILKMDKCFRTACPGESLVLYVPGSHTNGNHTWSNALRIGKQRHGESSVWVGIFLTGSGSFDEHWYLKERLDFDDSAWNKSICSFVDEWTPETNAYIEKHVAETISKVLSKRIEKATSDLKTANEKHAEYYGKAE